MKAISLWMRVDEFVYFRGADNLPLRGRICNVGESLLRIAVYSPLTDAPGRELTYHIVEHGDVIPADRATSSDEDCADEAEFGILQRDLGRDPESYISQNEVHNLIAMLQAGDIEYAIESLRARIPGVSKAGNVRYISSENMDIIRNLHANKEDVSQEHFYWLTSPTRVPVTVLDFGCKNVDIMSLVERHTPSEALRIIVDAADRFGKKEAAAKSPTVRPPPPPMRPQPKVRPGTRPSKATPAASSSGSRLTAPQDEVPSPDDLLTRGDTLGAPLCKHWVLRTCNFEQCKYAHTGPGSTHPDGMRIKRRRK